MGKVKLTKISSQSFEHELDRKALEALKKTIGFDRLIRALTSVTLDKLALVSHTHNYVRCGPKQVPRLWRNLVLLRSRPTRLRRTRRHWSRSSRASPV